jgi:hypothetical protein
LQCLIAARHRGKEGIQARGTYKSIDLLSVTAIKNTTMHTPTIRPAKRRKSVAILCGGFALWLASPMLVLAAAPGSIKDDLAAAYSNDLKAARGILDIRTVCRGDESADSTRLGVSGHKGQVLNSDKGKAVEYARYAANAAATAVIHNSESSTAGTGVWGVPTLNEGDLRWKSLRP